MLNAGQTFRCYPVSLSHPRTLLLSADNKLSHVHRLVDEGYTLAHYRSVYGTLDFRWSSRYGRRWTQMDPAPVRPAGAPRKRGQQRTSRIPGRGDDNQRPISNSSSRFSSNLVDLGEPGSPSRGAIGHGVGTQLANAVVVRLGRICRRDPRRVPPPKQRLTRRRYVSLSAVAYD